MVHRKMFNAVQDRVIVSSNTFLSELKLPFWIGVVQGCRYARHAAVAAALFMTMSVPAAASDKKDCFSNDLDTKVIIRACSRVIQAGALSDDKLAEVYNRRAFMRCMAGDYDGARDDYFQVALYIAPQGSIEFEKANDLLFLVLYNECK